MATNLPSKRYMAGERTERHLRFVINSVADTETEHYIDIAKALSAVNRRLYRQGLYYYVAKMTVHNSGSAWVRAATVPDTWMTKNAWKRGYRMWRQMQSRASNATGQQIAAKWHDFKVAMDGSHTFGNSLLPCYQTTSGSPSYTVAEWAQSILVSDDPQNSDPGNDQHNPDVFPLHIVGPHNGQNEDWTSIGLIASYGSVITYVTTSGEPEPASDLATDPLTNLFDAGDSHDEVLGLMNTENDLPPYNRTDLAGEASDDECVIVAQTSTGSGGSTVSRTAGFCVPFGLLKIITQDPEDSTTADIGSIEIDLEIVPGTYKGVYAERVM